MIVEPPQSPGPSVFAPVLAEDTAHDPSRRHDFSFVTESEMRTLERLLHDWLSGYASAATRRSYGDALGLDRRWVEAIGRPEDFAFIPPATAGANRTGTPAGSSGTSRHAPPTRPGRYRDWAWLRWCDRNQVHPLRADSTAVKRWQLELGALGMPKATRAHRLAAVGAMYAHLAEHGAVTVDPTRFDRSRLGLGAHRDTSPTVVLTAEQVERLMRTAATPRRGVHPVMRYRSVAIVALLTLGVRIGELTGLRRGDVHTTRGRRALRVTGKGNKVRTVYLSTLAASALDDYLAERDRWSAAAVPALPGQLRGQLSPLIATRDGGPVDPRDMWSLLRRLARSAGPALADVADRMGPHVLRHFYVTTAAEAGVDMTHIQADVGHSSVETTHRVYNQAARSPDRSAVDAVEQVLLAARARHTPPPAAAQGMTDERPLLPVDVSEADEHSALQVLWNGLRTGDPVEQLHGLQLLRQALRADTPSSAADRVLSALIAQPQPHPRVLAEATALRRVQAPAEVN
ncbi:site-specific recombinase XerD [Saccharothrix coeruleofusca]|uniref:tyrosine-type recombinase/integrase n=1 Tax=Saccharothrix coeruleofusca TaxID=33919 RepID=UPI001AE56502|nr:tyrosine-type recombinase/integrase [Saccharothrix coeruleofusca]MBP2336380.1 site-specific recombinase XerD [Saccharothrix coeruleofusca]